MTHVGRGSRLALRVGDRTVTLRALADLDLDGDWSLPVLALAAGLGDESGEVEIATDSGVVTVPARLVHDAGGLALRRTGEGSVDRVQRRNDVRGPVALPLRAAVVDPRVRRDLADLAFDGATLDVSAGGLRLDASVDAAEALPAGARIFVELELPDDVIVPAVLSLVEPGAAGLRGPFVDIAAADRERLVRLVFAEQRRELKARRGPRSLVADLLAARRDPYGP